MKTNPRRAHPARVMAALRKEYTLTVKQAWRVYRKVRALLDAPVALHHVEEEGTAYVAQKVTRRRVAVPEVREPVAPVPPLRAPAPEEFTLAPPPPEVTITDATKVIHDVTARIKGPPHTSEDTLKNLWWRIASGHPVGDAFTVQVVDWRKTRPDGSVAEYRYSRRRDVLAAIGDAKPFAIVQGGKRALRVAIVSDFDDAGYWEWEITVAYGEQP